MLNIGNKAYRNLPEQVAENMRQIGKLWEKLDGLDIYDNVIVLTTLDPLTSEQLEILNRPVSFIVYSNNVYMKRGVSGSYVYFDKVYQVSVSSGVITFDSAEIIVEYPLGTISTNSGTETSYTKLKVDELLNLKADKSDTYTKTEVLNLIFPIGSVFASVNNVSPAGVYGGTWEVIDSGNLIQIPFGEKVPAYVFADTHGVSSGVHFHFVKSDGSEIGTNGTVGFTSAGNAEALNTSTASLGEIQPNNLWADLRGGLTVYMWKRTA